MRFLCTQASASQLLFLVWLSDLPARTPECELSDPPNTRRYCQTMTSACLAESAFTVMAKGQCASMWLRQLWTNHESAAKAIATVCAPLCRKISDLAAPQMFASSFVRDICTPITKTSASLLRRFLQIPSVQWIGWDKVENPPWNLVLEPELLGREAVSQTLDLKSNCRCRLFVFPLVQTISCMSHS